MHQLIPHPVHGFSESSNICGRHVRAAGGVQDIRVYFHDVVSVRPHGLLGIEPV